MRPSARALIELCGLLAILAATPAALPAEPPSGPAEEAWLGESVDVRVVNIDVRVTDRAGRRVNDLVQEDFALEEDGKPVAITNFAPPSAEAGAPPVATRDTSGSPPAPSALSRRQSSTTLVLFDDLHLTGASRARVVAGLRQRLEAGGLGERVVVITYGDDGLHVRAPLGSSNAEVLSILAAMPAPVGLRATNELRGMLQTLRDMQRSAFETGRWAEDPPCSNKIAQGVINYGAWAQSQARSTMAAVAQLLDSVAALPGPKMLLFVTDGLPLQPGLEGFETLRVLCDGTGARQGLQYAVDVDIEPALRDNALVYRPGQAALSSVALNIASDLQKVAARANAAGVEMFTIQATGLAAGNSEAADSSFRTTTQEERNAAVENARDSLTQLASETGGEALINTNDFGAAIAASVESFHGGYSLGFSPVRSGDDRLHTLKLSTRRPGLTLHYRRSYRDASATSQITQQLSGALLQGLWRDPWGVGLELQELPTGAVLNLSVPMAHLAGLPDRSGEMHGSLTIYMALRGAGGVTPIRQVKLSVVLPKDRTPSSRYAYGIRVKRPPGQHSVALLLRDDLSAETVLINRTFTVPPS